MKSLSLAAGLGETGVRDMLKRTQSPSIDAVARVARVLGMTLSELYEGKTAAALTAVPLIGETGSTSDTWFELSEQQEIIFDAGGRLVSVETPKGCVAIYHAGSILIYEKCDLDAAKAHSAEVLVETNAGGRYFSLTKCDSSTDTLTILWHGGDLVLGKNDIAWTAKWIQTIPKVFA